MLPHMNLLGFFHTEKQKKIFFEQPNNQKPKTKKLNKKHFRGFVIPNGCLDAYEVKVNIDIFKYQEKVKLISQFQRYFSFFNEL